MSNDVPGGARVPRRRRPAPVALAALAALVLALAGLGFVGARGDAPNATDAVGTPADPTRAAEPTTGADGKPPVAGPAAGPTSGANELPPSLAPVAFDRSADAGNGVTASVEAVEAIRSTGTGPGNIAGPALRVTVTLENGTADPVDLLGVIVDLAYGPDLVPAPPQDDPTAAPFSGTLAPGDEAEGVYVFRVPADDRESVTVSVGYRPGAPYLVFSGSAD